MIKIKKLSFYRNNNLILDDISINFEVESIIGISGISGIGKSTFLKCIASLENNYKGIIEVNNKNILNIDDKERANLINYIPQGFSLFSNLNIIENCTHPLINIKKIPINKSLDIANYWLNKFDIESISNFYSKDISGGQQQRAALARGFSFDSKIILLDEPTSALDNMNIKKLEDILISESKKNKIIIIISHNLDFLKNISSSFYNLDNKKLIKIN